MSAFRQVPSKQRNGQPSPTGLGIDRFHGTDDCKCGTSTEGTNATMQNNKFSGLLLVNQQLLEENELLRQCIMRMVENSDLRSMNALSMILSQNDERLRNFITESIIKNSPRESKPSYKEIKDRTNTPSPKSLNTSKSKSYGTSFKEINLSELDDDTVFKTPAHQTAIHSGSYTIPRSTPNPSPNQSSYGSYGNWSKGIDIGDLVNQTQATSPFASPSYGKRSLSRSERGSYAPDTKSYGKSFKEVNFSDLFSPMSSEAVGKNASSTNDQRGQSASTSSSYGNPFPEISLRELEGESEINDSFAHTHQATLANTSSSKNRRNESKSPRRHQTSPVVRQPPMRFGLGPSPYQKSPSSPRTDKSPTRSVVMEQSIVRKSVGRNKNRRRENTHYSPYQFTKSTNANKSKTIKRPSSSPVKSARSGEPQTYRPYSARTEEPETRGSYSIRSGEPQTPRPHSARTASKRSTSSPQNNRQEYLSTLLKQVLSSPHDSPKQSLNVEVTKQPSRKSPIGILKQTSRKLHGSFSDDSLDKSVDKKNIDSFTKNITPPDSLRTLAQKTISTSPKPISTLGTVDSPILSSTRKYENYNQIPSNKIPVNFTNDNEHSITNDTFSWKPFSTMKDLMKPRGSKMYEHVKPAFENTGVMEAIETRQDRQPTIQINKSLSPENTRPSRVFTTSNTQRDVPSVVVSNENDNVISTNKPTASLLRRKYPDFEQSDALGNTGTMQATEIRQPIPQVMQMSQSQGPQYTRASRVTTDSNIPKETTNVVGNNEKGELKSTNQRPISSMRSKSPTTERGQISKQNGTKQAIETSHLIPQTMQVNQMNRYQDLVNSRQSRGKTNSNIQTVATGVVNKTNNELISIDKQSVLSMRSKSPLGEQGQRLERSNNDLEETRNYRNDAVIQGKEDKSVENQSTFLPMLGRVARTLFSPTFKESQDKKSDVPNTNDVSQKSADNARQSDKNNESITGQNLMVPQWSPSNQQILGQLSPTSNSENESKQQIGNWQALRNSYLGYESSHKNTDQATTTETLTERNNGTQSILNGSHIEQTTTRDQQGFANRTSPLTLLFQQDQLDKLFPKSNTETGENQIIRKAHSPTIGNFDSQQTSSEQSNRTLQISEFDNTGPNKSNESHLNQDTTRRHQDVANKQIPIEHVVQQQQISIFYPLASIVKQKAGTVIAPTNVNLDTTQNGDVTATTTEQPSPPNTAYLSVPSGSQMKQSGHGSLVNDDGAKSPVQDKPDVPNTNDVSQKTAHNASQSDKSNESLTGQSLMVPQGPLSNQQRLGQLSPTSNSENESKQQRGNLQALRNSYLGFDSSYKNIDTATTTETLTERNNGTQSILNGSQIEQTTTRDQQGFANRTSPLTLLFQQDQLDKLFPKSNTETGVNQIIRKAHSPTIGNFDSQQTSSEQSNRTLQISEFDNTGPNKSNESHLNQDTTRRHHDVANKQIPKEHVVQQQQISNFYPLASIVKQKTGTVIAPTNVNLDTTQNGDVTATTTEQPSPPNTAYLSVPSGSQMKQSGNDSLFNDNGAKSPVQDRHKVNESSTLTSSVQKPHLIATNAVGMPIANSTPKYVAQSRNKSPLSHSRNDWEQALEFLTKFMGLTNSVKAKYILHRAIDGLLGYTPNLEYISSAIQTFGELDTHVIGEICFQLDRRILEYVFRSLEEKTRKRRSRYYGYSVASILQLIDKEVRYADDDAEVNNLLRYRLEEILKKLQSLGYNMEWHAQFTEDMVNQFGLLDGEAEPGTLGYIGMKEPAILRVLISQTMCDSKELDGMLVILDCLLYMAHLDGRKFFFW